MEGQSPPTASAEGEQGESDDLPAPQPAEPGESAGAAVGAAPLVGGCGLGAGMLFLGCFPLVLFGAVVGSIVGVFFVLQGGTSDEGALLLDQLAVAEERWHAQHGSYFEGPPWPEGAFLLDGGSCRARRTV